MAGNYRLYRGMSLETLLRQAGPLLSQDLFAPAPLLITGSEQMAQRCRRILVQQQSVLLGWVDDRPSCLLHLLPDPGPYPAVFHDREQLTFAIWNELEQLAEDAAAPEYTQPLSRFIEHGGASATLWRSQLARLIAQVFSDYLSRQAAHLPHWRQGQLTGIKASLEQLDRAPEDHEDECWQLFLWQKIEQKFAEATARPPADGLPPLLLVGSANLLTPCQQDIVDRLSEHTSVTQLLLDVRPSLGQASQMEDIRCQWTSLAALHDQWHPPDHQLDAPVLPPTRLAALQTFLSGGKPAALPLDQSISCHACAGPWRQVEVLRDQLLSWFDQHPDCPAHEVAVLAPQMDTFAPCIAAVFPSLPAIPYQLLGTTLAHDSPLTQALFGLLDLPSQHFRLDLVAKLLTNPCFADLGDEEERAQWVKVFERLSIRFGYTSEELQQQGLVLDNSWRAGLQRLITLLFAPDEEERSEIPAGRWPELESLINLLEELNATLAEAAQQPLTLEQWATWLQETIEPQLRPRTDHPQDLRQLKRIRHVCQRFQQADPSLTKAQPLAVFRDILWQHLQHGRSASRALWAAGVVCSPLSAVHGLAFRAIFILGLDDGVFPPQPLVPSFTLSPAADAPTELDQQNHLFLHAVLAARERLCLLYSGQDPLDGRTLPPSVLLLQLKHVLDGLSNPQSEQPSWPVQHPLHAASRSYFSPSSPLFSYDIQAEKQVRLGSEVPLETAPPKKVSPAPPPPKTSASIELRSMRGVLAKPHHVFLSQFHISRTVPALPSDLGVFTPPYFDAHRHYETLVSCWWRNAPLPSLIEWIRQLEQQGLIAPAACTHPFRKQLEYDYHQLTVLLSHLSLPKGERRDLQFCPPEKWGAHYRDHPFIRPGIPSASGSMIVGRLDDCILCYQQNRWHISRCYYRPSHWKSNSYDGVFHAILLLASDPEARFYEYEISTEGGRVVSYGTPPGKVEIALANPRRRLAEIVDLYQQGCAQPWPNSGKGHAREAPYFHDWPQLSHFISTLAHQYSPHDLPHLPPLWDLCAKRESVLPMVN